MRGILLLLVVIALVICNSYYRCEVSREVVYHAQSNEIHITKRSRILALITAEGAFPEANETIVVHPKSELSLEGDVKLSIPEDATTQHDKIRSGMIDLHFSSNVNTVSIESNIGSP